MKSVGSGVFSIIRELGLEEEFKLAIIRLHFYDFVNPPLSDHLWPASLKRGELLVLVDSDLWLFEVRKYKSQFVQKLNPYGVREVRFRLGRVFRRKRRPDAGEQPVQLKEIPKDIEGLVDSEISDPELRDRIKRVISRALARTR